MSSSVKRAKAPSQHTVKTTANGKRYVDLRDVIHGELERIEETRQGGVLNRSNPSRNGDASRNGNKEGDHT